ncbi:hypothetical protein SCLCIDRAFT_1022958 [Scleroderma citrinum Foug A]|uniref:Uncharacterized protein n=1 Tax=Scleroderma citrinum Foug A TaxID=1036808 RepID=A0A0C3D135_9AGAM|nr:hypothetical protein SCLCIDRAFT_1022958 [Scleroderma citrinum Foug A]
MPLVKLILSNHTLFDTIKSYTFHRIAMCYSCHHCDAKLKNKSSYDRHTKNCVKTATFTDHNEQQITVTHNDDGFF